MNIRKNYRLLVLDFCNISEWTESSIFDLQKKYDIYFSKSSWISKIEKFCLVQNDPRNRHFALIEDSETIDFKKQFETGLSNEYKPYIVLPSENEHKELHRIGVRA